MTRRDSKVLVWMAVALVSAASALGIAAVTGATWLAVVATALIIVALVQRDRFLVGRGGWVILLCMVVAAIFIGLLLEASGH